MNENRQGDKQELSILEAWLKTANDFWGAAMQNWTASTGDSGATGSESANKPPKGRIQESWQSGMKTAQALAAAMSEPEAVKGMLKGINTLPDFMVKMVQPAWESLFHLQKEWIERAGRIGKSTAAYDFENLDQEAFRAWTEIYEKEFRQFLQVPQLGLTRFYQERAAQATDKFHVFQAKVAEFCTLLFLPMERSAKVMQDKLAQMADEGKLPQKTKDYYGLWIKILEGHYMTLFKSPEYAQELRKTIDAMSEFLLARQKMLEDLIRALPVPTQQDMDDFYKEIYVLKKRIRELEKKVKDNGEQQE